MRWDDAGGELELKREANNITDQVVTSAATDSDGQEHLVTLTWDTTADEVKGYLNGAQVDTTKTGLQTWVGAIDDDVNIGANAAEGEPFIGMIDEVRISDIARDACWIGTEHSSQKENSALITLGSQENLNYNYRKKITIDKDSVIGAGCSADLSDFPFLVTLTGSDFAQIADNVDSDGFDIIFKDANGNRLDHEIEEYDETTDNRLNAWVRIPTLYYDRDTVIYMYYGNPGVDAATENPAGVWDSNFKGVWHLDEEQSGTGTADLYTDSTGGGNHGDDQASATGQEGTIAAGQQFDGSNDYVDMGNVLDYGKDDPMTYSAWIKASGTYMQIAGKADNSSWQGVWFYLEVSGELSFQLYSADGNGKWKISTDSFNDSQWHHVVATYDGSNSVDGINLYADGSQLTIDSSADQTLGTVKNSNSFNIGAVNDGNEVLNGYIDEVRLSDAVRDLCWIQTEHSNQSAPAGSYAVGPEEGLNYQYRKKITVSSSQIDGDCSADIPDFPLLVTLTGTDFTDIENDVDANGYGLNFKAETDAVCGGAGTAPCVLDHEIELYDTSGDKLVAWVRIPTLDYNDDTVIYLHYGNPNITASTENAAGVWDQYFLGVWHLDEEQSGTGNNDLYTDSAGNSYHGDDEVSATGQDGTIGSGQQFDGSNDYINLSGQAIEDHDYDAVTIEAWYKSSASAVTDDQYIYTHHKSTWNDYVNIAATDDGGYVDKIRVTLADGGTEDYVFGTTDVVDQQWHHIAMVRTGGGAGSRIKIYVDGEEETDAADGSGGGVIDLAAADLGPYIGDSPGDTEQVNGYLDEVRVSSTDRDACWIGTSHSNQKSTSTLISVTAEESWTFDHYKTITIDQDYVGASCTQDLSDFPVMIHIDGDDFDDIANDVGADGYDIIFKDANGNQLAHEMEKYDETTDNELIAWVRVPRLSYDSDTVITIHYGNDDIDAATENPAEVWDSNFVGVWHLNETVTDEQTSGTHDDSTGVHGGSQVNNESFTAGKIADAQKFDGTGDYINVGSSTSLEFDNNDIVTISAWVRRDGNSQDGSYDGLLGKFEWSSGDYRGYSLVHNTDATGFRFEVSTDGTHGGNNILASDFSPTNGIWYHVAGVADGSNNHIYVNGELKKSVAHTVGIFGSTSADFRIGIMDGNQTWNGIIDEARVSNTARDLCWIQTEYNNQDAPATFYSISSERIEAAAATAVDLLTFMATGEGEAVNVAWKTAAEIDNKGFHLYRADTYEGPFERLTDKLIPGAGFMTQTRAYNFMDAGVTRGKLYYYQLEDIDIRGKKTQHGPVCVDWDGDGIPDDWEQAFGLDPDLDDAEQDPDKDGLSNYQEYLRGSDPRDADSDGDGIIDGEEAWKLEGREAEGSRLLGRGVEIVSEDAEGLVLELRTSGFEAESVTGDDGREYARLRIEDYIHGHTNEIGRPQLPVKGILLDMPPGKSARISVLETDEQHYGGYLVYPVPEQIDETRRAAHGPAEVFVIDETFYFHDENYPAITAGTGRRYVFRGQAKHQILFYPLAFNPAFGDLTLYSRIRLRVDYVDSTLLQQGGPQPVAWQAPVKDNGLTPDSMLASMNLASLAAPGLTAPLSPVLSPARMLVSALWSPFSDGDPEDVTAYKILTSAEGIYRLTAADLAAAGIDTAAMDLSLIRLYYQGTEAAVYIHDADSDDTLDAGDYILFYGQAADSIYAKFTESAVFWLTLDGGEGVPKRMSTIDAAPAGGTAATDFTDTVRHETDALYGGTAPGSDSVDRWFFATYIPGDGWDPAWVPNAGDLIDFDVALPGALDTGTVTIELFATFDQDHEITVAVNGTGYGTVVWSGIDYKRISLENVPLADGTNTVSLACSSGEDTILLDWIAVDYERNFAADGNSLKFSHGADYRYTVSNLNSSALMVFDISDASDVGRVSGAATTGSGPYSLEFEPQTDADRTQTYLVVTDATIMSPDSIVADVGGDLGSTDNGADYILITHRDLGWDGNGDAYDWLTDLIDLRQAQGLRVKVVDVADIYDEFSYGHVTPRAVRDFLAYAYGSWTAPAPRYVLLVGDHTYDYKNINGGGAENFVPAWLAYTDYMGETVTDEYFGRISGDDAVPDLYIGRLPAKSTAEAAIMVQKIIDYEQATNTKTWQKDTLLVADDRHQDYERIFEVINEDAAGTLPAGMNDPARAYLNQYVVARDVTADIKSGFDNGALIVNYSGHGATQLWASERIFDVSNAWPGYYADVDDLAELSEADRGRYPFVVSMSCLSGYFAGLGAWENPSLMEALLRAENKGAAATLMPTGETTTEGQHILNSALFEALFTDDIRRLGPAVTAAKQTLLANGGSYYEQVSETFLLFGDPAMELKVPLPRRPAGLTAGLTDAAAVVLSRNSATDANGNAVAGYHVYRSTTAGSGFIQLTAVPVTDTAYSDDTAVTGTTYYYTVTSVDDDGDESVPSASVSVELTDSDEDGLPDVIEAAGCTGSGTADSDDDGLADGTEDANKNGSVDDGETDPCSADSDGDSLPDGWEYENGLNALYDGGSAGTNGDADGDGWTNYQEYLSCSAPDDADSLPSAPTAPAVNYPADGGEADSRQPQLSVNNAADPDCQDLRYVFEVYADAQLTSLVAKTDTGGIAEDDNTTAWQVPTVLSDNTNYYWRVRTFDGMTYGPWTATTKFFVNTEPEPPTVPVVSRPPHESEATVLQPTLQVVNAADADGDAISYTFSVYADEHLSDPVTSKTGVVQGQDGSTAWQVDVSLEDNTSYWWTVQAVDDEDLASGWSPATEFFINTFNDPPSAPAGGSPVDGAEVTTIFPQLEAVHATDDDYDDLSYFFEIDTAANFDSFELEQSAGIVQQAGDTTGWVAQELMDNTTYHWRVRAYDGMAYGDWLNRSFFVNTENDAPQAPVIANPGNLGEVTSLQPTLSVKAAVDADNDELEYDFELYGDAQLSAWIGGTGGPDTAWQVEEALEDNRSYFWRARAVDEHDQIGAWSQTASFFVNTANDPPDAPVLNNPISGGMDTSLTPILSVHNAGDLDRDALTYEFELYADPDLTRLVRADVVAEGQLITAWTVPTVLADGGTYYWRVRADDGELAGAWMPTAVVEIHTSGADTEYEVESRKEVSADATEPQAVDVTSVDSSIYKAAVWIPPGALKKACTINIGAVTNPPALPARTRAVGKVIEFGPSGWIFAEPLTISLPYTAVALKRARVADTAELRVFYYDPNLLAWIEVEVDSSDPVSGLIRFKTNHFSMYTIAAPVAAAGGGGGGAACFVSTLAGSGEPLFGTGWTTANKFGLLALFGLLWLGRRRKRR